MTTYFIIYKTTNLINGKYYIGKHQTNDLNDGYVGSGKLLKRAIKKYGLDNFKTEILEIYDSEWKMNVAEKILVVIDPEVSYNLCPGGKGGFGYINKTRLKENRQNVGKLLYEKYGVSNSFLNLPFEQRSKNGKKGIKTLLKKFPNGGFYNKKHTQETKQKMSEKAKRRIGNKNSQFGTCWITNGLENKKIKKEDFNSWQIKGYIKGRTF